MDAWERWLVVAFGVMGAVYLSGGLLAVAEALRELRDRLPGPEERQADRDQKAEEVREWRRQNDLEERRERTRKRRDGDEWKEGTQ